MNYLEFILPSSIYSSNLEHHLMKSSQLFLWAKNLISIPILDAIHTSLSTILMLCILNRLYRVNCLFVIYKNQHFVLKWLPVCLHAEILHKTVRSNKCASLFHIDQYVSYILCPTLLF